MLNCPPCAGIFFERTNLTDILACATAFNSLLNVEYEFVIARKGVKNKLRIVFHKNHFYHLAGLHYLIDIQSLRGDREKIFDRILNQEIKDTDIKKSKFYQKIQLRIEKLAKLENFFDDGNTVFRYNSKANIFSLINSEYLVENNSSDIKQFAFIDKNPDGFYFCRSFFPQEKYDYSIGQTKWTLLSKKKILKQSREEIVLYEHKG